MSLLARWRWGAAARLVNDTLRAGGVEDTAPVVVVARAPFAATLREHRDHMVLVTQTKRVAAHFGGTTLRTPDRQLPFVGASVRALVGVGLDEHRDWPIVLREWVRVLAPGGLLVLVDQRDARGASRRALNGGLVDLEQRSDGRAVVTSGRVRHL